MPDNIWKRSADPKQRAKEYKSHEKRVNTKEMRTTNVVRQSALDKLMRKDGKMNRK